MKIGKIILTAALALLTGASVSAQDFIDYGVKAGLALNMMPNTTANKLDEFVPNIGFNAGAFATYYISGNFLAQAELLYARRGVSTVNNSKLLETPERFSRNIHYAQLPLLFGYAGFSDGNFRLFTGPEFGFLLGNTVSSNYSDITFDDSEYLLQKFNFSWVLQASYFLSDAVAIDAKVDQAISKTFKPETHDEGTNFSVTVGISYRFGY